MIKVLPSSLVLVNDEEKLINYAKELMDMGVEYLHCDVMDGEFVENKALSFDMLEKIRNNTNILLDVHLMINNPLKKIKPYLSIKPNIITVHYEAFKNIRQIKKLSKLVRSKDILFGISIKPKTPVSALFELLDYLDLVLVMSVEPGKGGQEFIESSIQKIKDIKLLCGDRRVIIEVDGGINESNYAKIINAGAEFLVMGKGFYSNKNRKALLNMIDKHYS
ncbi:MAG: ribulose-phosphate 3-epimerase [Christensenellales bacterium]